MYDVLPARPWFEFGEEDERDAAEVLGLDAACSTLQSIDLPWYVADDQVQPLSIKEHSHAETPAVRVFIQP